MKLAVLGGGGVRSAFLAKSLTLYAKELNIDTIVFMDSNKDKLSIFGEVSKEVSKSINSSINFKTTLSVEEAVEGADYIITTIRVGEDLARIKDETIPLELGILGQETTGAGGFAMAMRSVAVLLEYSKIIEKKANKNAVTFNFTNPAALVTQALSYAGVERNFGICDGPAGQIHEIKQLLGYGENASFEAECYGLNHLSWFKNFKANGKDVNDLVLKNDKLLTDTSFRMFDKELIDLFEGSLPNTYLYFFYYREKAVQSIIESKSCRSKTIYEINQNMISELKNVDVKKDFKKAFEIIMTGLLKREKSYMNLESKDEGGHHISAIPNFDEFLAAPDSGGYAAVALEYIRIVKNGTSKKMIINSKNHNKAISFLEADDIIESDVMVNADGSIIPEKHENIPNIIKSLILSMKQYERVAAKAILNRSIKEAKKALTMHPLIMSYSLANKVMNKYLEAHKDYIKDWK